MKGDSNGTIPKYGRTINLIEIEGLKLLGKENLTIGTISSLGQGLPQAGKGYADKRSAYIRVVFRDDKLVHFHVWRD
jgi:hypothetical protein